MQASMAEGGQKPTWLAVAHTTSQQSGTGLQNAIGENNCFLNAIIQCLWHNASFRLAVMQWPSHAYQVRTATVVAAALSRAVHTMFPSWVS